MRVAVAAFLGAAALARIEGKLRAHTDDEYWNGWQKFLKMPEVQERIQGYPHKAEYDHRFEIFKDNMDEIKRHNTEGHSWTKGITQFADMTGDEFKAHIGCMLGEQPQGEEIFEAPADYQPNAAGKDWSKDGAVTPVKNQGACGSCWAFSTTGSIEGACYVKTGDLVSLSEQNLVDCDGIDSGCNGGLMDYAFSFVKKNKGLCKEEDYKYVAKEHRRCKENGCTKYGKVSGYTDVQSGSAKSLLAAVDKGPVSIAIEADQASFQLYSGGVMTADGCGDQLDHGVLAVGYGTADGVDYWKVKNSWGASWGESGYIRLCRNCKKNGGAGQCGILSQPSYPKCAM